MTAVIAAEGQKPCDKPMIRTSWPSMRRALALLLLAAPAAAATRPEEIAEALSQLIVNTRGAVAENYTKPNKLWWLPTGLYRYILANNEVLPAAIAGKAFHPLNGGPLSLKMIVDEPRNEANRADAVELELFQRVKAAGQPAAASTQEAAYHARPIKAAAWCLRCHGEPRGAADPVFPKYKKEGWKEGAIVGAATARVRK